MVYDSLDRITSWTRTGSNAGRKTFAEIDNLGNFHQVSSNGTSQNISYSYSTSKTNELTSYSNSITHVGYNFTYNSNGTVTVVQKTLNSAITKTDNFYYTSSGLVSDLVSQRGDTTVGYSYRYNWQGARESKRVVKEKYGTTNLSNLDAMYYLTDASGGALIEYYGRRSGAANSDTVAYSAGYYNIAGGLIQTYLDGHTEYQIRDHLGSTRLTIIPTVASSVNSKTSGNSLLSSGKSVLPVSVLKLSYKSIDYNPYGEKLGSNSTDKRVDGYGGNIYDGETDYVPMGARWYLPEIGRFLSADPMWVAFPSISPYVYANDNPMSFKDPSGLAPEKEETEKADSKKIEKKGRTNRTLGSGNPLYSSWDDLDQFQHDNRQEGYELGSGAREGMESAMNGNHVTLGLMDQMKAFGTFDFWMKELGMDGGGSNGVVSLRETIIDKTGKVVDVIWDGTEDIVQVNMTAKEYKEATKGMDAAARLKYANTRKGSQIVGQTWFWNDFEVGNNIYLGQDKTSWVASYHNTSWSLFGVMLQSTSGGHFDIKDSYRKSSNGRSTSDGYLFMGRYTTVRNMGDFLAGWNASTTDQCGFEISLETFMRMAGALHLATQARLSGIDKYLHLLNAFDGWQYGPAPFYGELSLEGSYSIWGFMLGRGKTIGKVKDSQ